MYSFVMYLEVKVPGAEYTSCAIYFWAVPGKSTWRNSPYFSEHANTPEPSIFTQKGRIYI